MTFHFLRTSFIFAHFIKLQGHLANLVFLNYATVLSFNLFNCLVHLFSASRSPFLAFVCLFAASRYHDEELHTCFRPRMFGGRRPRQPRTGLAW